MSMPEISTHLLL